MEHPVSLEALQVLDAIDSEGSFAAAATALHRVPSAVTYSIRKLEEELGVALFDRSGHRAQLTSEGRVVLERGRLLLDASGELKETARRLATGWEPRLQIAVNSLIDICRLLPMIRSFHEAQPGTEIGLSEEVLDGVWDALESRRADLAIGGLGEPPRGMASLRFGPVDWVYVAARDHPAVQLAPPIDPRSLADATAVVAADSSRHRAPRSVGLLDLRRRVTVPHLAWKIAAHAAGLGIGWVPRHRVREELDSGRLVELQLTDGRAAESLHVAWRRDARGQALSWFTTRLREMDLDAELL